MKKPNKQSLTVFIPITNLDAIWKGTFNKLPPNSSYELEIDYPLDRPAKFKINTGKNGMSLVVLLGKIGKYYHKVYEQEDLDIANHKEGRYGIWGHDIEDLSLEGLDINHKRKTIKLSIGS